MNFLARLFGKMPVTRSQTISIGNNIQANGKLIGGTKFLYEAK